ncbi:modification methylase [Bacillus inaquosorum]|uniref:DNA methyltransferase n=2 Tax=Bacillus inaquosorum TaxID=483913 RepID=UPI00227DF0B7|nr:DNA methyltransferase [Bacillus inaquosorum]MCY7984026.1 modification methylase [Bacillus inaquosorum]MCY8251478.1 modification methylase [Bacillus inaquosorum]MCY8297317.1 modification methylase [Bacillus inaquosorum]MCY8709226.1 modification methylase [Bacillus inaquosorum]MCY9384448.1 modification methylase [Bacillus inaquosorum]
MEKLIELIFKNKEEGYWDFKKVHSVGIHKIANYPATMVPDMQYELIKIIAEYDGNIKNVLDPFHGSGVTLVESKTLGIQPYGIDINPLAHLITKVKLEGLNKKYLKSSLRRMEYEIFSRDIDYKKHHFNNINKWFREDIIRDLSKLKQIIQNEKVANIRRYYWVCLINIIKKYSNTRTTTFKLHMKLAEDISKIENKVFEDFIEAIHRNHKYLSQYSKENKYELKLGDSVELLKTYDKEKFDLICTSPPYGDNATTVTYGQYSMLPIYWIDYKDMDITTSNLKLVENYSSLDSFSMGGRKKWDTLLDSKVLSEFLDTIIDAKKSKVINFFMDYENSLKELVRILKKDKYMVITLGNRRVDNKKVPMVEFSKEFLVSKGFKIIADLQREIPMKRMPKKVSRVKDKSVHSMNQEHILIAKK